jgi:site-specific DNA-adenine methylase
MNMNDFYYKFAGNKRRELHHISDIVEKILPSVSIVVEPFGGSASFSRWLYKSRKDITYKISDVDKELVYFCNTFHTDPEGILARAIQLTSEIQDNDTFKETWKRYKAGQTPEEDRAAYLLLFKKWCGASSLPTYCAQRPKYRKYLEWTATSSEFFRAVPYEMRHFKEVLDEYKDNPAALLFLDPPYLSTSNEWYYFKDKPTNGMSANEMMWQSIRDVFENGKCRVILIVKHDMWMDLLFAKYKATSYAKKYEGSKACVVHDVYIR